MRFIGVFTLVVILASLSLFSIASSQGRSQELANSPKIIARTRGNNDGQPFAPAPRGNARPGSNGITYHGGPLLDVDGIAPVTAYYIWYGNWSGNSATNILTDLAQNIGPSPYFNINTTYYDANNNHVVNTVAFGGSTTDSYSRGTTLSDSGVAGVVSDAITSGRLPNDTRGVYFVLTSADVNESSGFCTSYCGWHTYGTIAGSNIKFAFIGNPARCLSACAAQTTGPNGNAGADGMASIIAHELEEAVTDPNLNAWYQGRYSENADKCAWTFGTVYTTSNGAKANMRLGSRDYLIQQNWVNALGGYCGLSY
jgi:Phosphate-induced protein 1 conserved region